ncbi:MAG: hypothetical protein JNL70_11470 [Saprospiraceae bacterium]|nr:hypothetical protein [Saprospiraceae bacterium]
MSIKILTLTTLVIYSVIVSQSFMYILSLKQVQLSLDANTYMSVRKLIDTYMRANFTSVVYAALIANLVLVISTIKNPSSLLFITAAIGFIALIVDALLTLKGNLPVNDIINTWTPDHYPTDWADFRAKWFSIFQYRQIVNIIGFVSLLIGAVFGSK